MADARSSAIFRTRIGGLNLRIFKETMLNDQQFSGGKNMRAVAMFLGFISCSSLAACGTSEGGRLDSNLQCAALISAATFVIKSGKVDNDSDFMRRALATSMTHLNTYAIPNKIREAQAFKELKALRATLMDSLQPSEIMSRAKRCADRIPL